MILNLISTKIKQCKFHQHKSLISIENIDINKIVLSKEVSFGKRILNVLLAIKIRPFRIFLLKMIVYRRGFD